MGFCTEAVCDGCSEVIHRSRIITKNLMTTIARKEGWSIGKNVLCPKCKKNRAKLKKEAMYGQMFQKRWKSTKKRLVKLDSITTDSINIFDSVYEISGDGRYSFVDGIKEITDVKIVDERDESIRISVRTHWNPTTSEEEELVKQRFSKLLNSMEQSLAIHRIN